MSGKHTPTPWFVSGIRFKMNHREWLSVNRYDEAKKTDENIAIVGYDPRDGLGFADAHFIVKAVNSHDELVKALERADAALGRMAESALRCGLEGTKEWDHVAGGADMHGARDAIRAALASIKEPEE